MANVEKDTDDLLTYFCMLKSVCIRVHLWLKSRIVAPVVPAAVAAYVLPPGKNRETLAVALLKRQDRARQS